MFWGFQTVLCQQLICLSHVAIAQLMSVTVLSLQTRLCFLSVTSLSLLRTRTQVSVPLLSLQCAIVTWQTLCNDSNSSTQVCDGNSEIGHMKVLAHLKEVIAYQTTNLDHGCFMMITKLHVDYHIYGQVSKIGRTLAGNKIVDHSCSWSIACQHCCNYIFILNLIPGIDSLGKDNCKTRRVFVHLILEIWW